MRSLLSLPSVAACIVLVGSSCANGQVETGSIVGTVRDGATGEPLGFATAQLLEIKRGEIVHGDGAFHFVDVPLGTFTLRVTYQGYEPYVRSVIVHSRDTTRIVVDLVPARLRGGMVVVTARPVHETIAGVEPTSVLSGTRLHQQLGATVATTLRAEPGFAERTMGGVTARPIVRGLGGDRLTILQDGEQTGDLSASSSDHAVSIDPLTAERIEVVRGAGVLAYSSHALGGVINVVSDRIAPSIPDRVHGSGSLQGETSTTGIAAGMNVSVPVGPLAVQLEGTGRSAEDVSTPAGEIRNTGTRAYEVSLGASVPWGSGYVGGAAGIYRNDYGVPGGFVGAHPKGASIELDRRWIDGRLEYLPASGKFRRVELRGAFTRYYHRELESNGSLGAEFGLLSTDMSVVVNHDSVLGLRQGALGASIVYRDFAAGGLTSIPPTVETTAAGFVLQEAAFGPLTLRASARLTIQTTTPNREQKTGIGFVRHRLFSGVAAAVDATCNVTQDLLMSASVMHTFRPPSIDELFSEGPHLASYSFDVGNPDLAAERALGFDATIRYAAERLAFSASLFQSTIDGYIYSRNTGDTNVRTLLPVYQSSGGSVRMVGAEGSLSADLGVGLTAVITASYVHGTLQSDATPLPSMPPLHGNLALQWNGGSMTMNVGATWSATQSRVAEFEQPTAGFIVLNAVVQYRISTQAALHAIVVGLDNALGTEYRQHLSRTKSTFPEPGRSLRVGYRIYF